MPEALFQVFQLDSKGAKACKACRSRQELSNDYLLARFGFDTAENEPLKVLYLETQPLFSREKKQRTSIIALSLGDLHTSAPWDSNVQSENPRKALLASVLRTKLTAPETKQLLHLWNPIEKP